MRPGTRWRLVLAAAAFHAVAAAPIPGAGQERDAAAREDSRWVPGFSAFSGVLIQDRQAAIESVERGLVEGDSNAVFGFVGFSAELATPALGPVPGRPRLFVHGDASILFDSQESVANQGSPGPLLEMGPPSNPNQPPPVAAVTGQGSAVKVQTQPLGLSAGAGVAFSLEAWERAFRIKPSIEWQWQEDEVTGQLGVAESIADPGNPQAQCPCRKVLVEASTTQGFHSLGAGLEIEMDAARAGPVMLSLYTSGQAYHVLGDRTVELTGTGTFDDGDRDVSFVAGYERDPWHCRIGVGLRLRWLPE
jgi:hypothetical protein